MAGAAANSSVGKIYIRGDINGLPPGRQFAIHIHEKGDCTGNFAGAGGHFNPGSKPHGRHDTPEHHAGDLPNLSSDGEGVAVYSGHFGDPDRHTGAVLHRQPRDRHP